MGNKKTAFENCVLLFSKFECMMKKESTKNICCMRELCSAHNRDLLPKIYQKGKSHARSITCATISCFIYFPGLFLSCRGRAGENCKPQNFVS